MEQISLRSPLRNTFVCLVFVCLPGLKSSSALTKRFKKWSRFGTGAPFRRSFPGRRFRHVHCITAWWNNWTTEAATHQLQLLTPIGDEHDCAEKVKKCWECQYSDYRCSSPIDVDNVLLRMRLGLNSFCQKSRSGGWRGIARHFGKDLAPRGARAKIQDLRRSVLDRTATEKPAKKHPKHDMYIILHLYM